MLFEQFLLFGGKRRELETEGQMFFDPVVVAE